jgi:hypothetical protein
MLLRLPELREEYDFDQFNAPEPQVYPVFEWILVPLLEGALAAGDLAKILRVTAFLEDLAVSAPGDAKIENLLAVAIGEWLNSRMIDENQLAPWLGEETKRVCGYVPGLAAQRTADRIAKRDRTLSFKLKKLTTYLYERN